jgi:AraC-like DNA-binding protein
MGSGTQGLVESAHCSRSASPDPAQNLTTLSLRHGLEVTVVRPGSQQSVTLTPDGTHLCISVAGRPIVWSEGERPSLYPLKPHVLHVLRQPPHRSARRIDFHAPASLAVVIHIPSTWCAGCPRGPRCQVARFLMHGAGDAAAPVDDQIELDAQGRAHARALLTISISEDAAILAAEQMVLALVAWAYARRSHPQGISTADPSVPPRTLSKLRLAAEILSQRLDDPPTISELSMLVGMNACDLKRCFKCVYGDSIASYSRNRRLAAAQDLLNHSELSVAEIALEVGYTNPSQFARAFRQHFDVNPAAYRRAPGQRARS